MVLRNRRLESLRQAQARYRATEKGQIAELRAFVKRIQSGRNAEDCARRDRARAEARDAQRLKEWTD